MMRTYHWAVLLVALPALFAPSLLPHTAQGAPVATAKLPPARLVQENSAHLRAQGCTELPYSYTEDSARFDVPAGQPYRLVPGDSTRTTIFYCSAAVASTVTVRSGEVSGWFENALGSAACWQVLGSLGLGSLCGVDQAVGFVTGSDGGYVASAVGERVVGKMADAALKIVEWVARIVAQFGFWAYRMAIELLIYTITVSGFVTNPLVRAGWPFMLGVANLGFMIALLFIAFSATLRLSIGNPYKMLPRLFGAAILVNFSLVIAGSVTDLAQLLMAIFSRYVSQGSISQIGDQLRAASGLVEVIGNLRGLVDARFDGAVSALAQAILIWIVTLAMFTLAIGMLVRYVALILLLIISPLAYLAFAFPGAGGLASRWWSSFLRYVMYGPVALFILLIALRVGELGLPQVSAGSGVANIINLLILSALLVAAGTISKSLGGRFAAAAINMTTNQGRRAAGWARRNPAKAAAIVGGVATGGIGGALLGAGAVIGARKGGQAIQRNVSDFGRSVKTEVGRRARDGAFGPVGRVLAGPERDAQGRPRRGQQSTGTRAAGAFAGAILPEGERGRAARVHADAVRAAHTEAVRTGTPHQNYITRDAFNPGNLRNPAVAAALSNEQRDALIDHGSNPQMTVVINSPDIVERLTPEQTNRIFQQFQQAFDGATTDQQRDRAERMIRDFGNTIDRVRRAQDEDNRRTT